MYFSYNGTIFELVGSDFVSNGGNKIKIVTDENNGTIQLISSSDSPIPNSLIGTIGFEEVGGYARPYLYFANEAAAPSTAILRNSLLTLSNSGGVQKIDVSSLGIDLRKASGATVIFQAFDGGILLAAPTQITGAFTAPNSDTSGTSTGIIKKDSNGFLKLI